jgi:UPF0716 protein FxsA
MFARLALLFILVPLIELALLVRLGQAVGFWPTLGLVVVTGIAGAALARAEGLRALRRFQQELGAGRMPGGAIQDGLAILVGGAFLLTPGLLTDVAGFALVLPPSRRWIQGIVRRRLERRIASGELQVFVMNPAAGFPFGGGRTGPGPSDPELDPRHEVDGTPRD